jgi:hypothetical protein
MYDEKQTGVKQRFLLFKMFRGHNSQTQTLSTNKEVNFRSIDVMKRVTLAQFCLNSTPTLAMHDVVQNRRNWKQHLQVTLQATHDKIAKCLKEEADTNSLQYVTSDIILKQQTYVLLSVNAFVSYQSSAFYVMHSH